MFRDNQPRIRHFQTVLFIAGLLGSYLLCQAPAQAQGLGAMVAQNMAFDQQMNAKLQGFMTQLQAQRQTLLQNYIQQQGPRLYQDYQNYVQQTGQQIPFQYYAYFHMASNGGRNAAPVLAQQQQNFQALQRSHNSMQQSYDSYNQAWNTNQQRLDDSYENYSREAVRGNSLYVNPYTGQVFNLPHSQEPGFYEQGHNQFQATENDEYRQLDHLGYADTLEPYEE